MDGCSTAREQLHLIAECMDEYAGIPMPLEGEKLVVEESYPFANFINDLEESKPDPDDRSPLIESMFYSHHKRCLVAMYRDENGKLRHSKLDTNPWNNDLMTSMRTMACSAAWGVEQEHIALQTLAQMLPHRKFKEYLLANMFLERSERSGVFYLFRKLRPTVAMRADMKSDQTKILCTMCMHPIGYYKRSYAGAMCPTDDVIAHLALMRADEHAFWRRCNQVPPPTSPPL